MTSDTTDTSNTSNNSNAGISGETGGGWFLPDRVDLPFVEEFDDQASPAAIKSQLRDTQVVSAPPPPGLKFQDRSWSARWYAWLVLIDFAETETVSATAWKTPAAAAVALVAAPLDPTATADEIALLASAARDERADALGEILSQDVEFITYFMGLLGMTPGSHPATYRVMHIANLIGTYAAMYFKGEYNRPRPSQVCPALRPPIPVPGHSSFPSGHATQARLIARCIEHVLSLAASSAGSTMSATDAAKVSRNVRVLARRIARNREIAGLHYPSDSVAGRDLADALYARLILSGSGALLKVSAALTAAAGEWQ